MQLMQFVTPFLAPLSVSVLSGWLLAQVFSPLTGFWTAVLLFCTAIAYRYPRSSLWLFLIYLPFSGTMIYALGPHPLLFLLKDAFYLPPLLALWRSSTWGPSVRASLQPLLPALGPLLLSCLLTLILVNGEPWWQGRFTWQPLLIGLVGLKALLGYVPFLALVPVLVRDRQELQRFMRLHLVLIAVCCTLLLVQHQLLVQNICAGSRDLGSYAQRYATLAARCLVGGSLLYSPETGLIRLPGTFVSPWQWAWFLITAGFLTYAVYVSDRQHAWRFGSVLTMLVLLTSVVISGQRVAFALVPVTFALLLVLTSRRRLRMLLELGAFSLAAGLLASAFIDLRQPILSFVSRWQASPPHQFILAQFHWTLHDKDTVLGSGLGRATNAARWVGSTKLVETYYAKLMYELGFFGMFAMLALVTLVTVLTLRAYRSLRTPSLRRLGICLWVFVVLVSYNTFYYPLDVDPVTVYYWLFAGVLLRLPALEAGAARSPLAAPPPKNQARAERRELGPSGWWRGSGRLPQAASVAPEEP